MVICSKSSTLQKQLKEGFVQSESSHRTLLSWQSKYNIIDIQKKAITKLQEGRTVKKIVQLDKHIFMAYSGLTADGRILANKARIEAQSFRINYDDDPSVEYLSKFLAETKQKYTQRGGVRPFGISALIAGIDPQGKPRLFYTDPSGSFSEWKAHSCGRNSKQVTEYLEKHYKANLGLEDSMKLVIKALLDVVESGNKNIELTVITGKEARTLTDEEIEKLIDAVKQWFVYKPKYVYLNNKADMSVFGRNLVLQNIN